MKRWAIRQLLKISTFAKTNFYKSIYWKPWRMNLILTIFSLVVYVFWWSMGKESSKTYVGNPFLCSTTAFIAIIFIEDLIKKYQRDCSPSSHLRSSLLVGIVYDDYGCGAKWWWWWTDFNGVQRWLWREMMGRINVGWCPRVPQNPRYIHFDLVGLWDVRWWGGCGVFLRWENKKFYW